MKGQLEKQGETYLQALLELSRGETAHVPLLKAGASKWQRSKQFTQVSKLFLEELSFLLERPAACGTSLRGEKQGAARHCASCECIGSVLAVI